MEPNYSTVDILCPGKDVQVEVINNYGNKIITKTTVYQLDDANLILNLPRQEGTFNQVNADVEVKIICKHNGNQDHVFFSKFIMLKEGDSPLVILSKPLEKKTSGHNDWHSVSVPFSYFMNDREIKGGVVKELSCFGLLASVKPDDLLEVGLGIPFKLILTTSSSPLLAIGTIVKLKKEQTEYHVTLDFSHLPSDLQDQITKFLFSIQNKGVKKEEQPKAAFIKIG